MKKRNVVIGLIVVAMSAYCVSPFVYSYLHKDDWKKETTPLPKETILTLCKNLSLSDEHPLCNGSQDVYAADFSEVLREYFPLKDAMETPKDQATITYQEVKKVIGEFEWECQEVVHAADISFFRCLYDFQGDRYWVAAFYFYYPENTLFSIRSGTSRDD